MGDEVDGVTFRREFQHKLLYAPDGKTVNAVAIWYPTGTGPVDRQRLVQAFSRYLGLRLFLPDRENTLYGEALPFYQSHNEDYIASVRQQVGLDKEFLLLGVAY